MDKSKKPEKTTPKIKAGVDPPSSINPQWTNHSLSKKEKHFETYVEGIKKGDRLILSQAITLIESKKPAHQQKAQKIIEACLPSTGSGIRLGVTGSPGVGKSTFIENFGLFLCKKEYRPAVLAIDPSSQRTKGSILGDKTRMAELAKSENAFIRPSPAGTSLGGVARKTRETALLCEAAGFNPIIIETVGVGQSEVAVHAMVDFFFLLILPGAGDELQGIKRGIVEMADLIAINKADGDRIDLAKQARQAYRNALHLFPPSESEWKVPVVTASGLDGTGIPEIWKKILAYKLWTEKNGYWQQKRKSQLKHWLYENIQLGLKQRFESNKNIKTEIDQIEIEVLSGTRTTFQGAEMILNLLLKH